MSIKVMSLIWDDGPEMQSERFVLLALADYANDDGECWPSIAGLMRKTCLSERGVQSVLRRLEASGWLEIYTGGGRNNSNRYTIKTPQMSAETPQDMPPQDMHPPQETPQMDAETPQMSALNPAAPAPEPSITIKEPSNKTREALLTVLSPKAADEFIAHRKHKRASLTEKAAQLIAKKLANHPDPDSVVEKSIMNGWTGVFPDSSGDRNAKPNSKSENRMHAFIAGARGAP